MIVFPCVSLCVPLFIKAAFSIKETSMTTTSEEKLNDEQPPLFLIDDDLRLVVWEARDVAIDQQVG